MKKTKDKLDEVDLIINSRNMSKEDEAEISAFIRKEKAKISTRSKSKRKRAA